MIDHRYGRIVNLGSQAGTVALPTESVYCMTRRRSSTSPSAWRWSGPPRDHRQHRGPDLHPHPGTELALADPAFRAEVEERIVALYRIGEPVDVAGAVVFLASRLPT